ncbi:hypothetical protein TNCV_450711 [Trichonephila clavipes]|nr:hypothetical protein TNCV_450711 [Trichonephila clavipes]
MGRIADHVKQLYLAYFGMKVGDQDKSWAHFKICVASTIYASGSKERRLLYNSKNKKLISYPDNIPSAKRFFFHKPCIPVPLPPTELQKIYRYIRSQVDRKNFCWSRYSQAYDG